MGQTANINVWIDDVRDLNSIALELGYNPAQIQIDDSVQDMDGIQIAPGNIPEPAEVTQNEVTDGEGGRIVYAAAQSISTGSDGSGVVASIELHGIAGGLSPLSIESVTGFDPQGNEIEIVPLSNGLINVIVGDAPPTSQPDAQPTESAATLAPTAESAGTSDPAPTAAPTSAPAPPSTSGGIYYVVQSGENLFRIGLRFGSTAQAIAIASNISDPDQVHAGHLILVPVSPPQGAFGYYVQRRDTVYSIARRFGMTVDELVTLNSIGPDYLIEVGQILTVTP
jgi:LysM repeat protein